MTREHQPRQHFGKYHRHRKNWLYGKKTADDGYRNTSVYSKVNAFIFAGTLQRRWEMKGIPQQLNHLLKH